MNPEKYARLSQQYFRLSTRQIAMWTATALVLAPAAAVSAGRALAQAATPNDALQGKLLVVELFFLIVGLAVLLALGFLIWQASRRKKEREKKVKR